MERSDHPGYYWLTYRWDNLYLACKQCNQKRKDRPHWDAPAGGPAAGKFDQFPLHDEAHRAMSPTDDLGDELPYLLDPCADEPRDYLRYGLRGDIRATTRETHRVFGLETIRICHLTRNRLERAREKKLRRVLRLSRARNTAAAIGHAQLAAGLQALIDEECAAESQFAGLAQAILDDPELFGAADRRPASELRASAPPAAPPSR